MEIWWLKDVGVTTLILGSCDAIGYVTITLAICGFLSVFNYNRTAILHRSLKYSGHSLTLDGAHIKSSDVVRVLGVLLTPNLSLDKHVT